VCTIVKDADGYAEEVQVALAKAGLRVDLDRRNEKINLKVREHSLAKTPALIAVGKRDVENRTVAIRRLGSDKQETLALDEAVHRLSEEARPPG
jgi:threonyl-tRNA synthetase